MDILIQPADAVFQVTGAHYELALVAMADIAVFFAVLMLGFAYVWKRGDLDWVRATPAASREAVGPGVRLSLAGNREAVQAMPRSGD